MVVGGGWSSSGPAITSVELLNVADFDKSQTGWVAGPEMPASLEHPKMIEHQNEITLLGLAGGGQGVLSFKITSPQGSWIKMNQKFDMQPNITVLLQVPDELVNCHL